MKSFQSTTTALLLCCCVSFVTAYKDARWEDVMVDPDKVQYKNGGSVVDVAAKGPCTYNTKLPVSGTGTVGGTKVDLYCLKTGIVAGSNTPYAITCGTTTTAPNGATVCMGFQGKAASGLTQCTSLGLTANQCNARYTVCDNIPSDIDAFSMTAQVSGSTNYVRITPKTLIVGQANSKQWVDVSAEELCWYHESIWKCINSNEVWNQKEFTQCTKPLFDKYVENLWLLPADATTIMNTVTSCNIFNPAFYKRQKAMAKKEKQKEAKLQRLEEKRKQKKRNQKKAKKRARKEADIAEQKDAQKDDRKTAKKDERTAERKRQKKCLEETNSTCVPDDDPSDAPAAEQELDGNEKEEPAKKKNKKKNNTK